MKLTVLSTICAICLTAGSLVVEEGLRIDGGTIVVYKILPDRVLIAADSRIGTYVKVGQFGQTETLTNDTHCKIVMLSDRFLFTSTGKALVESYPNKNLFRWESQEQAHFVHRQALESWHASSPLRMPSRGGFVNEVANLWAQSTVDRFAEAERRFGIGYVRDSGKDGGVVQAMFAGIEDNDQLVIQFKKVRRIAGTGQFRWNTTVPIRPNGANPLGETLVVDRILEPKTDQEVVESKRFQMEVEKKAAADRDWFTVFRLAELTVQYLPDKGKVGGKIDVAELQERGTVRWIRVKPGCGRVGTSK